MKKLINLLLIFEYLNFGYVANKTQTALNKSWNKGKPSPSVFRTFNCPYDIGIGTASAANFQVHSSSLVP